LFSVAANGAAGAAVTWIDAMSISSTGNVGIGTTNPGALLEVNKNQAALFYKIRSLYNAGGSNDIMNIEFDNTYSGTYSGNVLSFTNSFSDQSTFNYINVDGGKFLVRGDGNVGIGTASPVNKLDVQGDARISDYLHMDGTASDTVGLGSGIQFSSIGTDDYSVIQQSTDGLDFWGYSGSWLNRMKIAQNGNVGIGTTAPGSILTLGSANPDITVDTSDASDTKGLRLSGGGGIGNTRGALLQAFGNEHASLPGQVYIDAGAVAGSFITFRGGSTFAEQMRITNAGNVGIGTTNPAAKLEVASTNVATNSMGNLYIRTTDTATNDFGGQLSLGGFGSGGNQVAFGTIAGRATDVNGLKGYLAFGTSNNGGTNSEKMRIKDDGNVGIGTTDPSAQKLVVAGNVRVGTGTTGCVEDADGTLIAGTCSSDERLKTNIQLFDTSLEAIAALDVVTYNWRASEFPDRQWSDSLQLGLVAQQVEQHLPGLVTTDNNGWKQIRFNELPFYLLSAVKELYARISALAETVLAILDRLTGQDAKLAELEARVIQLEAIINAGSGVSVTPEPEPTPVPAPTPEPTPEPSPEPTATTTATSIEPVVEEPAPVAEPAPAPVPEPTP